MGLWSFHALKKIEKIMRITLFLTLVFSLQLVAKTTNAQNEKISLNLNQATIERVFDEIEKQTDYVFLFSKEMIDLGEVKKISVQDKSIMEVLDILFKDSSIDYRIINNKIILTTSVPPAQRQQEQTITITGKVVEKNGDPLPGVNVYEKSNPSHGVITSVDGTYSITITNPESIIVFSFVGFENQEIHVAGRSEINITLVENAITLNEVVSIGYGTQKKSDLTGSVVSIDAEQLSSKNVITLNEGLQGLAAGVQVMRSSGKPGAGSNVIIRGVATINNSTQPLYVVDGIMVGSNADFLNPNDIKSIEVLKDASATAIYGSRGANGVIMITTKGGKKGQTTLNVKADFGYQVPGADIEVAGMEGFTRTANQQATNDGKNLNPDWQDPSKLNYINWQDEMTQSSLRQQYYVSASGGSDNFTGTYSIGYLNDKGIIRANEFKRLTARTNLDFKVNDFIKTGISIAYTRKDGEGGGSLFNYAVIIPTMDYYDNATGQYVHVPVQYPDGTWGVFPTEHSNAYVGKGQDNPVAAAETSEGPWFNNRVTGNVNFEIQILKSLTFKTVNGINYNGNGGHWYSPRNYRIPLVSDFQDKFAVNNSSNIEYLTENYLTFDKTINTDHHFTLLAGYSANKRSSQNVKVSAKDFPTSNIRVIGLTQQPGTIQGSGGLGIESRQESYFGRVNYSLYNRYLVTATFRRDGSSNFGGDNKYGNFPSASFAWRVNEESFMQNVDFVSNLKVRLGWGQVGNAGYPTNRHVDQLTSARVRYYFYDYDNPTTYTTAPGLAQAIEIDPNLKWETNEQTNIGFDFGVLNNTLSLSFDWFKRDAKDLLLYQKVRPSTGFNNIYTNAGHIQNQGYEITLMYQKNIRDWKVNVQFNGSHVDSKTVDIGDDIFSSKGAATGYWWENYSITRDGNPVGSYFGYKTDGIFQNQAEIDALNAQAPEGVYQTGAQPGDFKYVDIDGDKKIDSNDRDIIGDGYADFIYGINVSLQYKQFDFNMNGNGVAGQDILSYAHMILVHGCASSHNAVQNVSQEYAENFWHGEGTTNEYTRPTALDPNHNSQISDAFILNGSFFKIQNIQIGYNVPKNILDPVKISSARVYFGMNNVATFSSYKKYGDPEIGNMDPRQTGFDGGRYPFPHIYSFGLSVGF